MTKEDFYSFIENTKTAEKFKDEWQDLQIIWETDPANMDLSKLASGELIPNSEAIQSVEIVKMADIRQNTRELFEADSMRFVELYKLIKKGTKLIPPIVRQSYSVIDGEIHKQELKHPIQLTDGEHRLRLCRHLNIEEIPILIIYEPYTYSFSKTKWDIDLCGENIKLTHKEESKSFSLPLKNHSPVSDIITGDYIFRKCIS